MIKLSLMLTQEKTFWRFNWMDDSLVIMLESGFYYEKNGGGALVEIYSILENQKQNYLIRIQKKKQISMM